MSCKREFPHLVEMHKKYADQGLAAVSVALDDPADTDARDSALKFLKARKATFTNLLLDEKAEVWQEKLGLAGPPRIYVFNRDGKYKKFEANDIDEGGYPAIERLVVEWLKQK